MLKTLARAAINFAIMASFTPGAGGGASPFASLFKAAEGTDLRRAGWRWSARRGRSWSTCRAAPSDPERCAEELRIDRRSRSSIRRRSTPAAHRVEAVARLAQIMEAGPGVVCRAHRGDHPAGAARPAAGRLINGDLTVYRSTAAGFPAGPPGFDLRLRQEQSMQASGRVLVKDMGSPLWTCGRPPGCLKPNNLDAWRAQIERAGERPADVLGLSDEPVLSAGLSRTASWPTGGSFTGLTANLASINANRKAISLSALPAGFALSVGDYISITVDPRDLHQVMEAATAGGRHHAAIRGAAASVAGRHRHQAGCGQAAGLPDGDRAGFGCRRTRSSTAGARCRFSAMRGAAVMIARATSCRLISRRPTGPRCSARTPDAAGFHLVRGQGPDHRRRGDRWLLERYRRASRRNISIPIPAASAPGPGPAPAR